MTNILKSITTVGLLSCKYCSQGGEFGATGARSGGGGDGMWDRDFPSALGLEL